LEDIVKRSSKSGVLSYSVLNKFGNDSALPKGWVSTFHDFGRSTEQERDLLVFKEAEQ